MPSVHVGESHTKVNPRRSEPRRAALPAASNAQEARSVGSEQQPPISRSRIMLAARRAPCLFLATHEHGGTAAPTDDARASLAPHPSRWSPGRDRASKTRRPESLWASRGSSAIDHRPTRGGRRQRLPNSHSDYSGTLLVVTALVGIKSWVCPHLTCRMPRKVSGQVTAVTWQRSRFSFFTSVPLVEIGRR